MDEEQKEKIKFIPPTLKEAFSMGEFMEGRISSRNMSSVDEAQLNEYIKNTNLIQQLSEAKSFQDFAVIVKKALDDNKLRILVGIFNALEGSTNLEVHPQ